MQGPKWTEKERAARLAKLVERNRAGHAGPRLYEDAAWMVDAYVTRGLTLREVADEAQCGLRTVARWMAVHGIPARSDAKPRVLTGEQHPNWRGGFPPCAVCGIPLRTRKGATTHQWCRDRTGEKGSNWRGENVRYPGAHDRVVSLRGKASEHACQHCGGSAFEWAYDHADPDEKRDPVDMKAGPYSLKPEHYMPLCVPCHRKFDLAADRPWRRRY